MISQLMDFDPITGARQTHHWDPITEQATLETIVDVQPIIDDAKLSFNSTDERARWESETMNRVATIPNVIVTDLRKRGIWQDDKKFRAWLNDPDNRAFRTRPGRV